MNKKNNKFAFFAFCITMLPVLFFTSKYSGLIYYILPIYSIFMFNMSHIYSNEYIYLIEISDKWFKELSNILFSDNQSENIENELNKSFARVRDFIKIAQKDGSGSYPEDFDYQGFKRDNGSIIHSKAPQDWGVDELYEFSKYADTSKRKADAAQMASWLEYDSLVNKNKYVSLDSIDPTLNSSGAKWYLEYMKDTHQRRDTMNSALLRNALRTIKIPK